MLKTKEPNLVKLGNKIRAMRLELGMSQEELALESGLDRSYVGSVERGERNVALLNIIIIATTLKTTASKLLEGIG